MSNGQESMSLLFGWEGNRRSGVALAVRRRLSCRPICFRGVPKGI